MKRTAVFILLATIATTLVAADTPPPAKKSESAKAKKSAPQPAVAPITKDVIKFSGAPSSTSVRASADSPLVQAARSGSENRGKSKLSIRDSDVKKSTGKLSVVSTRTGYDPAAVIVPPAIPDTTQADRKRLRDAAQTRLENAKKEVDDLEKELAHLEDDYYSEDNPDYREEVIEERFEKTKKQLDRARKELTDAREEAGKY